MGVRCAAPLEQRLGVEELDPSAIAAMDPAGLEAVFRDKPALHRYPASMAKRAHDLARYIVERYRGDTEAIWRDAATGEELLERIEALPGFGTAKARIFLGVLGKRLGVRPAGWEQAAADWASIADVDSFDRVAEIREEARGQKPRRRQRRRRRLRASAPLRSRLPRRRLREKRLLRSFALCECDGLRRGHAVGCVGDGRSSAGCRRR